MSGVSGPRRCPPSSRLEEDLRRVALAGDLGHALERIGRGGTDDRRAKLLGELEVLAGVLRSIASQAPGVLVLRRDRDQRGAKCCR